MNSDVILTFQNEPPANTFSTPGNSSTVTYRASTKTLQIASSMYQGVTRFNHFSSDNFYIKAKVVFTSDPSARKHFGFWVTQEGPYRIGYRFCHLDNSYNASHWYLDATERNPAPVNVGIQAGNRDALGNVAPLITVGSEYTIELSMRSYLKHQDRTTAREFIYKVNGAVVAEAYDAGTSYGPFFPGFFTYGCTIDVSEFYCSENIPTAPLLPKPPPATAGWTLVNDTSVVIPTTARGSATISGILTEETSRLLPYRRIDLYRKTGLIPLRTVYTNSEGAFRFDFIDLKDKLTLVATDPYKRYTTLIYDV